jgi:hypothetical protein
MAVLDAKLCPSDETQPNPIQKFNLESKTDHILLVFPDGTHFGCLRDNMTKAMASLLGAEDLKFEAVALTQHLRGIIAKVDKSGDAVVQVDINIYGPRGKASSVGEDLSKSKLWLQQPDYFKKQYPYENPHVIHFPELEGAASLEEVHNDVSVTKPQSDQERLQRIVSQVHQSLQREKNLDRTAGDQRLKTGLLK